MSNENSRRNSSGGHASSFANMEKAKDFRGTFKKMLQYVGVYKIAIFTVIIFALLSTLFTTIGPKVLGMATTELFAGLMAKLSGTGSINFVKIGWILLASLSLCLVSAFFAFADAFAFASDVADFFGFVVFAISLQYTTGRQKNQTGCRKAFLKNGNICELFQIIFKPCSYGLCRIS